MGCTPGGYQETAVIADGPDELTPAVLWKVLGLMPGDGFVDCVGMFGGFSPWLHVRLLPKMVNKINAIEYSGEGALRHIEVCSKCGGSVRVIACIEDQDIIDRILAHLRDKKSTSPDRPPLLPRA